MTIAAIAVQLLSYFAKEERGTTESTDYPGRHAAVIRAINGACQELFAKGKPWVRKDARGARVYAPVTIPLTVTAGSTSATIQTGDWQAWFAGCTIAIAGETSDNEIRNDTKTVTLKYPYTGTSGVVNATIYCDSITVGTDVLEVLSPVRLNRCPLAPRCSAIVPSSAVGRSNDYGFAAMEPALAVDVGRISQELDTPTSYFTDTWSPSDILPPKIRLRLYPAPAAAGVLDYQAMLLPPVVSSITSTDPLPIPFGFDESIFLPVAVKKLSEGAFWPGVENPQAIEDAYKTALAILADGNPNKNRPVRLVAIG